MAFFWLLSWSDGAGVGNWFRQFWSDFLERFLVSGVGNLGSFFFMVESWPFIGFGALLFDSSILQGFIALDSI